MKSPCKDCKDRCYKCHCTCELYEEYSKTLTAAKEKIRAEEYADAVRYSKMKAVSSKYRFSKDGHLNN